MTTEEKERKEKDDLIMRVCGKCGRKYTGHPALSREDGVTMVCPECGTRESLRYLGLSEEEQEEILETMRKYERWKGIG